MLPAMGGYAHNQATPFGINPWQGYQWYAQNCGKPWSTRILGKHYARLEVREGDVISFDANKPNGDQINRCELFIPNNTSLTQFSYDVPIWISFAIRVPASTSLAPIPRTTVAAGLVCGQMHGGTAAPGPPWSQQLQSSGDFVVATRSNWVDMSDTGQVVRYRISPLPRDVWHQFVYRLIFRSTSNGRMEMWRDGAQVFTDDIAMGFVDRGATGMYFKVGCYRHSMAGTSVIEWANVEVGTTDLTDRIANPLPIPAAA